MTNTSELEALEGMFLNAEKFLTEIQRLVTKDRLTFMEATMQVCDDKEIDPEDLVRLKLISPMLKSKLYEESVERGLMKQESRLPI